jgi:hypothetical protein
MAVLPPAPFGTMFLTRAFVLWLLCRLCAMAATAAVDAALFREGRDVIHLSAPASLALMGLVMFLTHLDARRRRELVLLANLAVSRTRFLLTAALPPALLELAIRFVP